jgi:hypothetical protein
VDFIVDNAVALAAIAFGVLVVAGLVVLVVAGLRLWRSIRAAQRAGAEAGRALAAEAARLSASVEALPARQQEVRVALAGLSMRAAALAVIARHAGEAVKTLRAPLRYLGR